MGAHVHLVFTTVRSPLPLKALYACVNGHPKVAKHEHWKAKLRQTVERGPYVRVDRGVWDLASRYSPQQIEQFEAVRLARYPRRMK